MRVTRDAARAGLAGEASRRASVIAAAVLCLLLIKDVAWAADAAVGGGAAPVPFTVALFVLPLLYAFPGTRPVLARHRWQVLAKQGVLTWVPFAVFGAHWQVGIGGLLAGLVLLMVAAPGSWLLAGFLLVADVVVRAAVTGLPWAPAWSGTLWTVSTFTDLGLAFFGLVWLAQLVGEVQEAHGQAAELAVADERLQAAGALQAAVGERLAGIAAMAVAARQALSRDLAQARAQIAAAGAGAREAVAQARAVTVGDRGPASPEPAAAPGGGVVIGTRLAWAVLVVVLSGYAAAGLNDDAIFEHAGPRVMTLAAAATVLIMALQLYHSRSARDGGSPRAWPVTLGLQAVLVYAFFLPFVAAESALAPFLAGSVLLLIPGRWRWAGYAAVLASWSALAATVPLRGVPGADRGWVIVLYQAFPIAGVGLLVYELSRLAGQARQLEELRGQLARMAKVKERLRVARDVHDPLGLGLSAIALKTDLIGTLIGRDDTRAAAELGEMTRICAAARADIQLVTAGDRRLSLEGELTAAHQIFASAGIEVRAETSGAPLPAAADEVLAPVLREAVTNILRHAAATSCTLKTAASDGTLRLAVSNDGAAGPPGRGDGPAAGGGSGLANLTARVQAAGGRLATRQAGGRFELIAEIPLPAPASASPATGPAPAPPPGPPRPLRRARRPGAGSSSRQRDVLRCRQHDLVADVARAARQAHKPEVLASQPNRRPLRRLPRRHPRERTPGYMAFQIFTVVPAERCGLSGAGSTSARLSNGSAGG